MADIYGAITESAINRAIQFLMTWRPSLFNHVAPSQYPVFDENGYFTGVDERWRIGIGHDETGSDRVLARHVAQTIRTWA